MKPAEVISGAVVILFLVITAPIWIPLGLIGLISRGHLRNKIGYEEHVWVAAKPNLPAEDNE